MSKPKKFRTYKLTVRVTEEEHQVIVERAANFKIPIGRLLALSALSLNSKFALKDWELRQLSLFHLRRLRDELVKMFNNGDVSVDDAMNQLVKIGTAIESLQNAFVNSQNE